MCSPGPHYLWLGSDFAASQRLGDDDDHDDDGADRNDGDVSDRVSVSATAVCSWVKKNVQRCELDDDIAFTPSNVIVQM